MRKEIYRKAELIRIPSQTTIFKAGDEGDYMYIVLKGLVLVEIRRQKYNISEVIASLKDGDVFGELALIDIGSLGGGNQP